MVSDLYVIDLRTFVWTKMVPSAEEPTPRARYFHSTDVCESSSHCISIPSLPFVSFRRMFCSGAVLLESVWKNGWPRVTRVTLSDPIVDAASSS